MNTFGGGYIICGICAAGVLGEAVAGQALKRLSTHHSEIVYMQLLEYFIRCRLACNLVLLPHSGSFVVLTKLFRAFRGATTDQIGSRYQFFFQAVVPTRDQNEL